MHITKSSDHNSITFFLNGRLDFTARHHMNPAIQEGYNSQKRNMVFDLAGVTFIDSAGLGLIHRCITDAEERKIQVTLINPQRQVHDLLELCSMIQYVSSPGGSSSQQGSEATMLQHGSKVLTREAMSVID